MRRLDISYLIDGVAVAGGCDLGRSVFRCAKGSGEELRSVSEIGNHCRLREEVGGNHLQVVCGSSGGKATLRGFGRQLLRECLLCLRLLLAGERGGNLRLDFSQRTGMCRLLLFSLNDVIAELGADQSGDLPRLQ